METFLAFLHDLHCAISTSTFSSFSVPHGLPLLMNVTSDYCYYFNYCSIFLPLRVKEGERFLLFVFHLCVCVCVAYTTLPDAVTNPAP